MGCRLPRCLPGCCSGLYDQRQLARWHCCLVTICIVSIRWLKKFKSVRHSMQRLLLSRSRESTSPDCRPANGHKMSCRQSKCSHCLQSLGLHFLAHRKPYRLKPPRVWKIRSELFWSRWSLSCSPMVVGVICHSSPAKLRIQIKTS